MSLQPTNDSYLLNKPRTANEPDEDQVLEQYDLEAAVAPQPALAAAPTPPPKPVVPLAQPARQTPPQDTRAVIEAYLATNVGPATQQTAATPQTNPAAAAGTTAEAKPPLMFQPNGLPVGARRYDDYAAIRKNIYDNVLKAVNEIGEISSSKHTLSLSDVEFEGPDSYSPKEQKQALLSGKSLNRRLRGTWVMKDKETGKVLDTKRMTVAVVPVLTDRGTYISNGNDYSLASQMRTRAGIYARKKDNGEHESHISTLPGKGFAHRIVQDADTGVFKLNAAQSQIPLVSLLRALGTSEDAMRESWGDLYQANAAVGSARDLDKLYSKFVRNGDPNADDATKRAGVKEAIQAMALEPAILKKTVGIETGQLSPEVYLAATKKLAQIRRGLERPDERDSLAYQQILGPEDLFAERINKAKPLLRRVLWKSGRSNTLKSMPASVLSPLLREVLTSSGLAAPLEEVNTAELLDQNSKISRMGYGGIPSTDSIPLSARLVQPSYVGFVDFLRSPESEAVGVDSRLASNVMKGPDGRLYAPLLDVRNGGERYYAADKLGDLTVALPDAVKHDKPIVTAIRDGNIVRVHRDEVTHMFPQEEATFSALSNMVPMKANSKGHRQLMASRMLTQALPLIGGQAPFVRNRVPGQEDSFEAKYGKFMGALRAEQEGKVISVSDDEITVQYADGTKKKHDLYHQHPFNRKTFLTQTPTVQIGDLVPEGHLLARSNYTDDKGVTALGANLRVAFIPYKGYGFEDAFVVSKSAARDKLRSEHLYQESHLWDEKDKKSKNEYLALFPTAYKKEQLENIDDQGLIKPGTKVSYGDPIALISREKELTSRDIFRGRRNRFSDESLVWKHHDDGVVTDVVSTDKGLQIAVKTVSEFKEGDKMSARQGNKGVAIIVDDELMPKDAQGRPFEVLLNPLGLPTRVNPSQKIEAWLGKIAEKTGKHYDIDDWQNPQALLKFAESELAKHGLTDLEDITDPETGRVIPKIATGNMFFMKLHHMSESKRQGRSTGAYTSEGSPAKGGGDDQKSKRVGLLESNALLAHGALGVRRDASLIRGQASPEYWARVAAGDHPPLPKVPKMYEKFLSTLQAAGLNPVQSGTKTQLLPSTKDSVDQLVGNREVTNSEMVDWQNPTKGVAGGLFDTQSTGWPASSLWSFIRLPEPVPSPAFEDPIKHLLGLNGKQFEAVIKGEQKLGDKTGFSAIYSALDNLDVDVELAKAREQIKHGKKGERDKAVRRLGLLKAAKEADIHPREWMHDKVPVLPPTFRPVSVMGTNKTPLIPDANLLYKEVIDSSHNLRDLSKSLGDHVGEERFQLYNAYKALTGLGEPTHVKNQERGVSGLLAGIFGDSPKRGVVQYKLLSNTVDLVGRSTIIPEPTLGMDEIGLPEESAWEVYKPLVIRNLVKAGIPKMRAADLVIDKDKRAKEALLEVMSKQPVFATRAPVLHKYGAMAFWPKLVTGSNLRLSPTVVVPFTADFDGNCVVGTTGLPLRLDMPTIRAADPEFYAKLLKALLDYAGRIVSEYETVITTTLAINQIPRVGAFKTTDHPNQRVYEIPAGCEVLTYDEHEGQCYRPFTELTIDFNHNCQQVETETGRTVTVSDNESLAVYDSSTGALAKMKPESALGKFVPVVRREKLLWNGLYSFNTGRFLGTLMLRGKSCRNTPGDWYIEAPLQDQLDNYIRWFREVQDEGLLPPGSRYEVAHRPRQSLHMLLPPDEQSQLSLKQQQPYGGDTNWLNQNMLPPELVDQGSEECLRGLLAAVISWGLSSEKQLSYMKRTRNYAVRVGSPRLVDQILTICRRLGVRTRVRYSSKLPNNVVTTTIRFNPTSIRTLLRPSEMISSDEAETFVCMRSHFANIAWAVEDFVPVPDSVVEKLDSIPEFTNPPWQYAPTEIPDQKPVLMLPRTTARSICAWLRGRDPEFAPVFVWQRLIENRDIVWDRVTCVGEAGVHDVFDLVVPTTKIFAIANGLVVYDTMNFHVIADEDAAREASEKMLPSKNLIAVASLKKPMYLPTQEYIGGLYSATRKKSDKSVRVFADKQALMAAIKRGDIDYSDPVEVMNDD